MYSTGASGGRVSLNRSEILATLYFDPPCPFYFFGGGELDGREPKGGKGGDGEGQGGLFWAPNS
jgi:hypothetical protein